MFTQRLDFYSGKRRRRRRSQQKVSISVCIEKVVCMKDER